MVPAGQKVMVELSYTSPSIPLQNFGEGGIYKVFVKRQPGIEGFQYRLIYNGKMVVDSWIDRDEVFAVE